MPAVRYARFDTESTHEILPCSRSRMSSEWDVNRQTFLSERGVRGPGTCRSALFLQQNANNYGTVNGTAPDEGNTSMKLPI